MTLGINGIQHNVFRFIKAVCHYAECYDCLNVMLSVVMLNVVRLNVFILSVVMPSVVRLNVVMLRVVAPSLNIKLDVK
jgi:hypothetical protein